MPRRRRRRRSAVAVAVAPANGRRGRPSVISQITTRDLHAELDRRQGVARTLQSERQGIERQLADLDRQITDLGGLVAGRRGRKPGRPAGSTLTTVKQQNGRRRARRGSLADALHTSLAGKTLSVGEALDAIRGAGYKSKSPNLRTMVNQQLSDSRRFKRVARGQYTAK